MLSDASSKAQGVVQRVSDASPAEAERKEHEASRLSPTISSADGYSVVSEEQEHGNDSGEGAVHPLLKDCYFSYVGYGSE